MTTHPVSERSWESLRADEKLALKQAAARLADEFTGLYGTQTIERFLASAFDQFADRATVTRFLPLLADRFARRRIADFFKEFEVAVRVAGFAFGGRTEDSGNVVIAFDVGLLCEIQITAVGLAFASERGLQIFFGAGAFERHDNLPPAEMVRDSARA